MKTMNHATLLFFSLLFFWGYKSSHAQKNNIKTSYGECTIGVAAGKATSDGRPLAWKTRDEKPFDQEAIYDSINKYRFVGIRTMRGEPSQGVNEKGLAMVQSIASDLPEGGGNNLKVIYHALGNCATIEEFEHFIDSITQVGNWSLQANYGIIDSTGAAAIYETTSTQYWKYDANDTLQAPDGFIVRTNFSEAGGGNIDLGIYNTSILTRYNRSMNLLKDFYEGDSLNCRNIIRYLMRDFADSSCNPIPVPYQDWWEPDLPYGYINTLFSICRVWNVSAAVNQGVLPDESGKLSTMWTMLNDPATSIAVPFWPVCKTPSIANNYPTPLYMVAYDIHKSVYSDTLIFTDTFNDSYKTYIDSYKLRDETGQGLWEWIFPAEDSVLNSAEIMLEKWRNDSLNVEEMSVTETNLAEYALSVLQSYYNEFISPDDLFENPKERFINIYPNPATASLTIETGILGRYNILITTLNGEQIYDGEMEGITHQIDLSSFRKGIYFITIRSNDFIATRKIIKQ